MQAALYRVTAKSLRGSMQQPSRRRRISAAVVHLQRYQAVRRCFSQKGGTGSEHHAEFLKQMQELQAERDSLFGFTDDDRNGWTNSKDHQFDQSFLDDINQARDNHFSDTSPSLSGPGDETESDIEETVHVQDSPSIDNNNKNINVGFASLSHLSTDGTSVHMVNVGDKKVTSRVAVAQSKVILPEAVIKAFRQDKENADDLVGPKGPIFATAKVAGIMAAKKTSELIPLCHPLPLDSVNIEISLHGTTVTIQCECRVTHKTGVEMEALTGATVAALTIYDMTKAVSHDIQISQTRLLSKSGGKRSFLHEDAHDKMK